MEEYSDRFQDENYRLSDFEEEVAVHCLKCTKKALASIHVEAKKAQLSCPSCGYLKEVDMYIGVLGHWDNWRVLPHLYFEAQLWYEAPYKGDTFWALNEAHLNYLEKYIAAKLRQSNQRTHFTLLEKLPKFYHVAKNRESLLKLIQKLKKK